MYKISHLICTGAVAGGAIKAAIRASAPVVLAASVLGCVATEEAEKITAIEEDGGTGLKVSLPDYRFGVQEVGSRTPQKIVLSNVGVDSYPINSVVIGGEQPDDYTATAQEGVTLEPGDKLDVVVAFEPASEGRRLASLDINYDTITGDGSNAVESLYYNARALEDSGDIVAASQEYRRYIDGGNITVNKPRAMIKLSLLEEADV